MTEDWIGEDIIKGQMEVYKLMRLRREFKEWAKYLVENKGGSCSESLVSEIAASMNQAFEKGRKIRTENYCNHKWNPNLDTPYCMKCGEEG